MAGLLGVELSSILAQVPSENWIDAADPRHPVKSAEQAGASKALNQSVRPTVCGEVLLSKAPPVPWAWSRARVQPPMQTRVARVSVRCP
jgi:hypothetical protein